MNNTEKTLLAFVAGAVIGTVTGILVAPDKGEKTRKRINKGLNDIKTEVNDTISTSGSKVKEFANTAMEEIEKYGKSVTDSVRKN